MEAFLEARALYYAIRQIPIVDDATISLMPGRLVIVVGPNGAGQSTLLKLLSGELRPTSGELAPEIRTVR
jgi:iron complex transport system ATP-binding protein